MVSGIFSCRNGILFAPRTLRPVDFSGFYSEHCIPQVDIPRVSDKFFEFSKTVEKCSDTIAKYINSSLDLELGKKN